MRDIILIGMPGCGKSTIGKILAKEMNRAFLDLDSAIEEKAGITINEIFATEGEVSFRQLETEVFQRETGKERVIATGGGIVTMPCNRACARRGVVVFLDRPLEVLLATTSTTERPLLKDGVERLKTLYQERYQLYCEWADIQIENIGAIEVIVEKIINEVNRYENYGD